jgi:hypothetical protein
MSHTINWVGFNPHITFNDTIDTSEIIFVANLFISDKRFDSMDYQLWDFRHVIAAKLAEADINIIGALDASSSLWNTKMMIALIATEPNK